MLQHAHAGAGGYIRILGRKGQYNSSNSNNKLEELEEKEIMELVFKIFFSLFLVGLCSLPAYLYCILWMFPGKNREILRKQGIKGPPPSLLNGNISEMKCMGSMEKKPGEDSRDVSHNYALTLFPYFERWRKDYGPIFMYSLRNVLILHVTDPDLINEIGRSTSLDLGKPSYLQKDQKPLFGQGILRSNGPSWAHQRKIIAPEFFMDKVMVGLMVESAIPLLRSWEHKIETNGGIGEIRVDEDLRNFSADVISRACFGSSYSKGKEIFLRLRVLQHAMDKPGLFTGIPCLRYLPTKNNRHIWRLDKEIQSLILDLVKEHKEEYTTTSDKDLLHAILEASTVDHGGPDAATRFVVDNCKNIYVAGHETTAVTATWCLMLLALNPDWQARARVEVMDICGAHTPDADMTRRMKTLTMVIQETLRLYPPSTFVAREALQDMKFGDIHIPKGINLWICIPKLHQDIDIWGPDASVFNPNRFASGIFGACKLPNVYIPFGLGPRTCLGQNFAMMELKVLLSLILSKFSFSLSPKYCHSPTYRMVVEPEHGLYLTIKRV
ncbi:cytochrome P450 714C2-like isoform X2 [Magnolia sinica]|uniref:cytochrome P450 714C2-like isoform X2 n=1 Tax=Magnolia sinica TaxID=86752 RepID=UPI00265B68CF|nr:cytochrome P450 714C2-like isoform X2 [Magnolia sinica]